MKQKTSCAAQPWTMARSRSIENNAQAAEHALKQHGKEDSQGREANPPAAVGSPRDDYQQDGKESDQRGQQAVGVLEEDSPDPFAGGKVNMLYPQELGQSGTLIPAP